MAIAASEWEWDIRDLKRALMRGDTIFDGMALALADPELEKIRKNPPNSGRRPLPSQDGFPIPVPMRRIGTIAAAAILAGSSAVGLPPAKAQITPKPDLSQVFVQMLAAQVDALRTLATAQLLTAQWTHVQACRDSALIRRWLEAMDCEELLAQLEAAKAEAGK